MLKKIKKHIPLPIKRIIYFFYQGTIGKWTKRRLFLRMQKRHQILLAGIKEKKRIRVVFLVIHKSVWKVDSVFKKMLGDSLFDPVILVCPYVVYGEKRMWDEMQQCFEYFNQKGYPTYSSFNHTQKSWIKINELNADLVFFTNPHNLTRKEYYEDAYLNYLSCYAGYGIHVANINNGQDQYNNKLHNALWKIFVQTDEMYKGYFEKSQRKNIGVNLVVDCMAEEIFSKHNAKIDTNKIVWKNHKTHKKIIFAPHHTVDKANSFQLRFPS